MEMAASPNHSARAVARRARRSGTGESRRFWEDSRAIVYVAALTALPALLLMPLFAAPFERDQGVYATIAEGWANGALPYRDLWDNKPPLLFLWYMLSFAWMGESIVSPRVMAAAVAGLCVPFVWATAKTLFGAREAALATALFALAFANIYLQVTANAEVFMLLPMTAGMWAFAAWHKGGRLRWALAAGALTSLAVLSKQSAVWAFIGYGVWMGALALRYPMERRRQVIAMAALAAGAILAAAPFVAYFAAHGALGELWHAMFGFNFGWAAEQSFLLKLVPPLLIEPGALIGGLVFWLLAGVGAWRLWKRNDRASWLILASLAASEAAAQTMGKGSAHYSVQLLPSAAIAGGVALPHVARRCRMGDLRMRAVFGVSAVLMAGALAYVYSWPTAEGRFEAQYTYRSYADDALEAPGIASATRGLSAPGECIYEWGRSTQIYFLADREPCSRWVHNRPYEVDPAFMGEVMRDLEARRPAVILLTAEEPAPPELVAFIAKEYRYAGRVEYATLYRRVEG